MEQPVKPIEPGQRPEDEDVINHAMALAIVQIKKALKDKVCVRTSVQTWSNIAGEITVTIPGSKQAWDEYHAAMEQYREDSDAYEAEQHGVSVQLYKQAKQKLAKYNQKKCDKAPEKDIDDFLRDMLEVPDDEEIIVAS